MKVELRPIQRDALQKIRDAFRGGCRRICVVAPTGFGKTVLFAEIVRSHFEKVPHARALVLVHRQELVVQTIAKLRAAGLVHLGAIGGGADEDATAPVQVATVQTLIGRTKLPPASLLVIDEAHHHVAAEWGKIADAYKEALAVGFTATPERQDGTPLGDLFDGLVVAAQTKELMDAGLQAAAPNLVVGPPEAADTVVGPLISGQHRDRLSEVGRRTARSRIRIVGPEGQGARYGLLRQGHPLGGYLGWSRQR